MPKGQKANKGMVFEAYKRRGGDISAAVMDTPINLGGVDYEAGDYLVNDGGTLEGAKKAEFENLYEPVKRPWKKKEKATEANTEASEGVQASGDAPVVGNTEGSNLQSVRDAVTA